MARRTKQDAQETRARILDAAECVFERRGVARTTLNEIAAQAGVTRGAIYWHFEDKAELFDAMMLRVMLPLEDPIQQEGHTGGPDDGLARLRHGLARSLRQIVESERLRRVFEIALHKVEYVDEMAKVRMRRIDGCRGHTSKIHAALQAAIDDGRLPKTADPALGAVGLHAMIDGLFQSWMLDREAFDLVDTGLVLFDTFIAGLAAAPAAPAR